MTTTITRHITFEDETCCVCGVTFFVPSALQVEAMARKRSFWCPNGHVQSYQTSEADKLRKELAETRSREERTKLERDRAQQLARILEAQKATAEGKLKRAKKRAAAGVCPCCHRTVKQMVEHIKTKHPEYKA